ncbi:MAG: ion channel [Candidatus Nanopelagicales bacterium]
MSSENKKKQAETAADTAANDLEVRRSVHRMWALGGIVALLLFLYAMVPYGDQGVVWHVYVTFCFGLILFSVILTYLVLRQSVGESPKDRWLRLIASLVALVASIIFFSLSYALLANSAPSEFVGMSTFVDALYFTIATTLTVGFGDVYASGQGARIMVICQMIFTVIVIAATGRSIVGIFQIQTRKKKIQQIIADEDL